MGQHQGLPATIIVSTTLKELESGRGQAVTGGGTLLPMSGCLSGWPATPITYLVVFNRHTEIPLYLGFGGAGSLQHMISFEHRFAKVATTDLRPD